VDVRYVWIVVPKSTAGGGNVDVVLAREGSSEISDACGHAGDVARGTGVGEDDRFGHAINWLVTNLPSAQRAMLGQHANLVHQGVGVEQLQ
jgi:hypothetical protein